MNTTLQSIIKDALRLQTYTPSDEVNRVMGALVHEVIETTSSEDLHIASPQEITKLQQISAMTESELEKFWSRRIVESTHSLEALNSFPYLANYQELTKREVELITQSGLRLNPHHKALVIGSGPLPLSAYELHLQTGVNVDHVDSSHEAIFLCRQFMEQLNVSAKYFEAVGESVILQDTYDVILIAALAGSTVSDKQKIIKRVLPHLAANGRIIIRSAKGARTLLYPGIASGDIHGVRLLEEYHPTDYIINSVFVYGRQHETRFVFN
jgi:precorrin-6B methylase 2